MSGLYDKSSLDLLNQELDDEIKKKEQKINQQKIDSLLKEGNTLCDVERFDNAQKIFEEALELDKDNVLANFGMVRAISEEFVNLTDAKIDKYINFVVKNDKDNLYIKNEIFKTFYKKWKKYLEDNPRDGIYSIAKLDELLGKYEYKLVLKSLEHYSDEGKGKYTKILADFYSKGIIVKKDMKKALSLYEKAFSQGEYDCAFTLGNYYKDNLYNGDEQGEKAYDWYFKGGQENQSDCLSVLREIQRKKEEEFARKYYWLLKEDVCIDRFKKKNIDNTTFRSIEYYANNNKSDFKHYLGVCYFFGLGTDVDYNKALEYESEACNETNFAEARRYVGIICENGLVNNNVNLSEARNWYGKAIDLGDVESMVLLANMYLNNNDKYHEKEAYKLYKAAYEKKNVEGAIGLATCYINAFGTNKDNKKAIEILKECKNNFKAEKLLAKCYSDFCSSEINYEEAFKIYLKNANKDPESSYELAICYHTGHGTEKDLEKYAFYMEKAAKGGFAFAYSSYAEILEERKDYKTAFEYYQKAVDNGDWKCNIKLGEYYENGYLGSVDLTNARRCYETLIIKNKDNKRALALNYVALGRTYQKEGINNYAFKYYQKGYEIDKVGEFELAVCYLNGIGTDKNYDKAFALLTSVTKTKNADAKYHLAQCYKNGYGVKINPEQYFNYLCKAYDEGYRLAITEIVACYEVGYGTNKDNKKAIKILTEDYLKTNFDYEAAQIANLYKEEKDYRNYFAWGEKALSSEDANLIYELAECYANGENTKKDLNKAIELYKNAASKNNVKAMFSLAQLYITNQISEVEKEEKAYKLLKKCAESDYKLAYKYLADCYNNSYGTKANRKLAITYYIKAAEDGDVEAMNALVLLYSEAKSPYENSKEAFKWALKSAEQCDLTGIINVTKFYQKGYGTAKNVEQYLFWAHKGLEFNNVDCIASLINFYQENPNYPNRNLELIELYKMKYANGEIKCSGIISYLYHQIGDEDKAKEWLNKNLSKNNPEGYYKLAKHYEEENDLTNAFENYNLAAKYGYVDAYLPLYNCYINGKGVEKNSEEAFNICKKMYKEKINSGALYLGQCYELGIGVPVNYKTANKYYTEALENNYKLGTVYYKLGSAYEYGHGARRCYADALNYYNKGYELGDLDCTFKVGQFHEEGIGVPRSIATAETYYFECENSTNPQHLIKIASRYEISKRQNYKKAFKLYKKAADLGSAYAMWKTGMCYLYGDGAEVSDEDAYVYFKKGSERKYLPATYELGRMYYYGYYVEKNYDIAFDCFNLAKTEVEDSYLFLGLMYMSGLGIAKNCSKAFECFIKTPETNDDYNLVTYNLALCYKYCYGTKVDYKKAIQLFKENDSGNAIDPDILYEYADCLIRLYGKDIPEGTTELLWKAHDRSNIKATYKLGYCYLNRIGFNKDKEKAFQLFKIAAEKDYAPAMLDLATCYKKRIGTKKNLKEALKWYQLYLDKTEKTNIEEIEKVEKIVKKLKRKVK